MTNRETPPETPTKDPILRDFQGEDTPEFVTHIRTALAEFGYRGDSKYDFDLNDPGAYYDRIWILENENSIAGSIAIKLRSDTEAQIKRMYITPDIQGKGHGQRLLDNAVTWVEREGVKTLWLVTTDLMKQAQRFYKKAGFRRVETFPEWDHVNPHDLYYRLDLPPYR